MNSHKQLQDSRLRARFFYPAFSSGTSRNFLFLAGSLKTGASGMRPLSAAGLKKDEIDGVRKLKEN